MFVRMWRLGLSLLLVLSVLTGLSAAQTNETCPRKCSCSKYLKSINCSGRKLSAIPSGIPTAATELFLDNNLLVGLPKDSFRTLVNLKKISLKKNLLLSGNVHVEAFSGLRSLTKLYLTQNQLTNISRELFSDLGSLEQVFFSQNKLTVIPDLSLCKQLTKIGLDNNALTSARFPPGYQGITTLQSIILSTNNIQNFSHADVASLANSLVRSIDLARCHLQTVDPGAFSTFTQLQSLSLSYNPDLSMDSIQNVIDSLAYSRLESLDLSCSVRGAVLPPKMFMNFSRVPLRTLKMTHMRKANVIANGTFTYLTQLVNLDLSYSKLYQIVDGAFDQYNSQMVQLNLFSNLLKSIPKSLPVTLEDLNLSNNPGIMEIPDLQFGKLGALTSLNLDNCEIRLIGTEAFVGLGNVTKLNLAHNRLSGNSIGVDVFKPLTSLQELSLKGNTMSKIFNEDKLFSTLQSLKSLDLSGNGCSALPGKLFDPLMSLQTLDLSKNNLGSFIAANDGSLFSGLGRLESLNLESNVLSGLPDHLIEPLVSLRNLTFALNDISRWGESFFNRTQKLENVNLSNNSIAIVNITSVSALPRGVRLNLTGNPFNCWCDLIWFRQWMAEQLNSSDVDLLGADTYTCLSPKSMVGQSVLSFRPEAIHAKCFPPPWMMILVIATSSAGAVVLFLSGAAYRYRWKIRLKWYKWQKACCGRAPSPTTPGYQTLDGEDDWHDLLVSYGPGEQDVKWVRDELIPNTDSQHDGTYRVYFEDRDVLYNESTIGQIADAMSRSQRILLVVSKEYLKDSRRAYEVELALSAAEADNCLVAQKVILVLMGEEVVGRLPNSLHPIVNKGLHLVWTADTECQQVFWIDLNKRLQEENSPLASGIQA